MKKSAILLTGLILIGHFLMAQWDEMSAGSFDIYDVHFTDANTGWIVGSQATIRHTADGGQTWTNQVSGVNQAIKLRSVCFINSTTGWIAGDYGTVLHTTNGGTTWVKQTTGVQVEHLYDIIFINENHGWACGASAKLIYTNNGGESWNVINTGTFYDLYSVGIWKKDWGVAVGLHGVSTRTWAAGTWDSEMLGTKDLWSIQFIDTKRYVTVGGFQTESEIIIEDEWGTKLLFYHDDEAKFPLRKVHFKDLKNGWIVGDSGTILSTNDSGNTWQKQTTFQKKFTGNLKAVFMVDKNKGFIVGDGGLFLKTANGGGTTGIPSVKLEKYSFSIRTVSASGNMMINYFLPCNKDAVIEISDINARLIDHIDVKGNKGENNSMYYNTAGLTNGIYIARLLSGSRSISRKFAISR